MELVDVLGVVVALRLSHVENINHLCGGQYSGVEIILTVVAVGVI